MNVCVNVSLFKSRVNVCSTLFILFMVYQSIGLLLRTIGLGDAVIE